MCRDFQIWMSTPCKKKTDTGTNWLFKIERRNIYKTQALFTCLPPGLNSWLYYLNNWNLLIRIEKYVARELAQWMKALGIRSEGLSLFSGNLVEGENWSFQAVFWPLLTYADVCRQVCRQASTHPHTHQINKHK